MLVVCRRWPKAEETKLATRVVNLAHNPSTPAEAIGVARAIRSGTVVEQSYGTVQEWSAERIAAGDWGAVQFFSPYLCEKFSELVRGCFFPTSALGEFAAIGPAGQRIREAFAKTPVSDSQGRMALWQHDTTVVQNYVDEA